MKPMLADWLWRTALVCVLAWIGWELHLLRVEMQQPAEDQMTAEAEPDPLNGHVDELRASVASLHDKVDAMMVAMMQLKR